MKASRSPMKYKEESLERELIILTIKNLKLQFTALVIGCRMETPFTEAMVNY